MKPWTTTEIQQVREWFDQGVPDDVMGEWLGRTRNAIKVKRIRIGITGDRNARRISDEGRSRMGDKPSGPSSARWKGGRRYSSAGYIEVLRPDHHRARGNGYVFEHILIAEKSLGRPITIEEHVHHLNGRADDNRPENLSVLSAGEHRKLHPRNRTGVWMDCPVCGARFYVKPSWAKARKVCSCKCAGQLFSRYFTGRPRDQRISDTRKAQVMREVSSLE